MRRTILAVVLLMCFARPSLAIPAVSGTCKAAQSGTSPVSPASLVVSSGDAVVVGITFASATITISSVNWNTSEALTVVANTRLNAFTTENVEWWGLKNPTAGTFNIDVAFSANPTGGAEVFACAISGVNQTTPFTNGTTATDTFADASHAITCTSSDMAVDLLYYSAGGNPAINGSNTLLIGTWPAPSYYGWGGSYQVGTNPTMAWATSAAVDTWSGMCIKAAAAGSTPPPKLTLLGVGN